MMVLILYLSHYFYSIEYLIKISIQLILNLIDPHNVKVHDLMTYLMKFIINYLFNLIFIYYQYYLLSFRFYIYIYILYNFNFLMNNTFLFIGSNLICSVISSYRFYIFFITISSYFYSLARFSVC
jgi:hypothetical protein